MRLYQIPSALLCCALLSVAVPGQVRGTVRAVDGRVWTGSLTVSETGRVEVATDKGKVELAVADLASFEQEGSEVRSVRTEHQVWLRSGAVLPVMQFGGWGPSFPGPVGALWVTLPCDRPLILPLGVLRAVRHGGLERPQPTLFEHDLANPLANEDILYAAVNNKTQRSLVTVSKFTTRGVEFLRRGEECELGSGVLSGVVFGRNSGVAPDRQPGPRAALTLTTGERIEGRLLGIIENVLIRLDEGCTFSVHMEKVHRLDVPSGKLVWLSDLAPKVEQAPVFDQTSPWCNNRSVAGPGFELLGKRYERGLGLVPRTRLTYDLGSCFDVFEALIGIDDRGGSAAHAVFRVYADGEQVFESAPMVRGQAPAKLRVALNKAKTLTVEVDFSKKYALGSFCAFVDARVIQESADRK
ncbi:MAG: NPCBM/NEW2 domain-containing protein [Planctomycetota bacterium]